MGRCMPYCAQRGRLAAEQFTRRTATATRHIDPFLGLLLIGNRKDASRGAVQ